MSCGSLCVVGRNVSREIGRCWAPAAQYVSISPTLLGAGGWFLARWGRAGGEATMTRFLQADRAQSWQIGRGGV